MEKKGYRAKAKYIPMSPFKIRAVADLVRGKTVADASALLENMPQKGARFLYKTINSAAANAMQQDSMVDEETLYINELLVDGGKMHKRIWPRARGKADRLMKRTSHITVVVGSKEKVEV